MRDPLANDQRLDDTLGDGLADALEDWASRTPKLAHEARTALRFDPASAAIKLAQGGIGEQYLVYERAGTWYFAAGPAAEVSVSSDTLHLRVGQWHRSVPVDDPVEAVATALASLRRHGLSRCYGWATFELAFLLHEDRTSTGSDTLIHLMLPEVEVQLDGNAVHTRTSSRGMMARITALLRTEPITSDAIPISIEEPDFASYEKMVATAIGEIKSRALDKVVLSRVVPLPVEPGIDLPQTYLSGRRANTPARSFLLDVGGWKATGFSPETIVEVDPTGRVRTQPLAGTRALHHHRETDSRLRSELLSDAKEVHEHAISVRLALDETRSVSIPGSVAITEFMEVEERGSVQHIASHVTGQLQENMSAWSAFAALFPAVTVTGVPKAAALRIIRELEGEERGLYGGAVIMADTQGQLDAALTLRTVFQRDGRSWLRAGAGVMGQSTPEREWEETCEKLRSIAPYLRGPRM